MKREIKILTMLLALCLLLTACQPTPEEDFIPQRDGDLIEKKIGAGSPALLEQTLEPEAATSYREQVEAYKASLPQHWSEKLDSESELNIDADIIVKNADSFSVYTVTRGRFDMKKMEDIANNFFKGVTGMRPGSRPSTEEYADAISSLNERDMVAFAQENYEEMKYASKEEYTSTDRITLSQGSTQTYVVRLADGFSGAIDFDKGYENESYMYYDSRMCGIIHDKKTIEDNEGSYIGEGLTTLTPSISQEQGEEIMNAFIQENGLEEFTVAAATEARHYDCLYMQEVSQGWRFTLMRTYGYEAINTTDPAQGLNWFTFEEDTAYSQPWRRETIVIYVSENGVECFGWNYPMEVTGIAAENVELLDFEQIQSSIRKLLPVCLDFDSDSNWRGEITKIMLTLVLQQAEDDPSTAYLMPVWVLRTDWYWDYKVKSTKTSIYSFFGVNALDGSRAVLLKEGW